MKPLPFDMTPLAQSLSLAPATRKDLGRSAPEVPEVSTPEFTTPDLASASEIVTSLDLPSEMNPTESSTPDPVESEPRGETKPAEAAPDRDADNSGSSGDLSDDADAPTASEPAMSRSARRKKAKLERRLAKRKAAKQTAVTAAPKPEIAAPTELRTASYPRHLKAHRGWTSQLAMEQIHALATHVLARHMQQNLRTLAVTSAVAGEGKTTITLALAEKLAGAGKRVLLLDIDTHRATLSRESGLEDAAGALQSCNPRDASNTEFHAYATDVPGVTIMPVGHCEDGQDGPPLVSPVHTGILILNAIEEYDLILLDCPPLLPVAETHVLREVVDAALMVVRAGSTPRDMLDQALDDFGRDKFMGAILNRTKPEDIPYFREVYGYYRHNTGSK
ncbi:MAG: tyrosine-protein kinase family protein [Planctomycetota bacterium]|jgi:Mrp family chromosome partitioning ATPase